MEEYILSWYSHVRRMNNERIPEMVLEREAEGRRRDRLRVRWIDIVVGSLAGPILADEYAINRDVGRLKENSGLGLS